MEKRSEDIRLDKILEGARTIGIAGHVRPDADCVGSCLGMYHYIKTYFPDVEASVYLEPIPATYRFLADSKRIRQPNRGEDKVFDLFIVVDCGDIRRIGDSSVYFEKALRTFCVDHHISHGPFADANYVDSEASSTCELLGDLMGEEKITKEIAECLYTGIVGDTGVFQYSCTHSSTMRMAGMLMDKGIDYPYIVNHTFFEKSWEEIQILSYSLQKAKRELNGKMYTCILTMDEINKNHASTGDLEGIVSELRNIQGCEVSAFLHENRDGSYKGSLRVGGLDINVAEIAGKYDGGGHAKAAGFTTKENPEDVMKELVEEIRERMAKL